MFSPHYSINRPALKAAASGIKGDNPAAIKSALIKRGNPASAGKKERAKVVFPAPLGPAMMIIFLLGKSGSLWMGPVSLSVFIYGS